MYERILSKQRGFTLVEMAIVMIVIGFLYLILPTDKILSFFHDEKFKNE